jgi:hypothetical protein
MYAGAHPGPAGPAISSPTASDPCLQKEQRAGCPSVTAVDC